MTDAAPADLGEFEGRKITKTTIKVTKAGDGLSQAMKIDPSLLHQGDKVYVVLETRVGPITFDPYDEGVCARVQNLEAGVATIMDSDVVKKAIDEQRVKNERFAEKEQGVQRLPVDLHDDHVAGEHADPVEHCPDCIALAGGEPDAEAEAQAADLDALDAATDGNVKPIRGRSGRAAAKR